MSTITPNKDDLVYKFNVEPGHNPVGLYTGKRRRLEDRPLQENLSNSLDDG